MKILHFADLHLGVETYGRIDPATGLSSRLMDCLAALDKVVAYAIENRVDLVVFCGDAYKSREPTQTQQREFARRVLRLSEADIPFFILIGNHDLPNAFGRATSTEIFDTLAVKNVYFANRPEVTRIDTAGGPVQIVSLPWLRRSALLSKEDARHLDFDQLNQKAEQVLTDIISQKTAELDPAVPAILVGHVWVTGAQPGTEKMMTIGQDPALLLSNVARPPFDYVALGHIHRHQVLAEQPPVVYAGSLERLDFGDEDDEKGFYVAEMSGAPSERHTSFHFQPLEGRRFLTINVALDAADGDPTATVLKAIGGAEISDAIVRLNIGLPATMEGQLRDAEIREALQSAHYSTIARETARETRLRLGDWTAEEMQPLDALKAYLESAKLPPERVKVLLEYGEKLLQSST